ncbi:uncharacterized protein LOC124181737 isoform X2 [Neodiprion fabricii]|uniref:uncharacterized protein LOC124181737 isoform X2 n=1 Tax=Neodiprion fabricii TaxID=2872261 RepID=UPI001ED95B76|nr:uncharacterized protein LOC124181737 isoform X2 [Neodiprion fabricii]
MTLTGVKTAGVASVIRMHENVKERMTKVIDVNINANLTVSNPKGSKFAEKSLLFCVLFFTSIFIIILFTVRRELQALKFQEQCIETKIAILMSKYEKVSSQLNRMRSYTNYNKYRPITNSYKSELIFSSNDIPLRSPSTDQENSGLNRKENITSTVTGDDHKNHKEYSKNALMKRNQSKINNRFIRTITNVTDENDNPTLEYVQQNFADTLSLNTDRENNETKNVKNDDNIGLWSEARTARIRRDNERRGKIRTKNKRRPNRSRRRLGPLVATFVGAIPEQHITDQGVIGPWVKLTKDTSNYDLQRFHLTENSKSIEITVNGLYMITAQMFYFGKHTNYSYWILVNSEGESRTQKITKCSAVASTSANEVSCHTNVVLPLRKGDRVRIQQEERDRLINLREGLSYVQLVLLSNEADRKRRELRKSPAIE